MVKFDEKKQNMKIEELHKKEEEELAKILSTKYGVQYGDLSSLTINTNALKLIPEDKSKKNKLAVFDITNKKIKVAVISPNNQDTKNALEELEKRGYQITVFMVSRQSIEKAWSRYKDISYTVKVKKGIINIDAQMISEFMEEGKRLKDISNSLQTILKEEKINKISKLFDAIMAGALSLKASDVHIEPEETSTQLRYRLDGILTKIGEIDTKTYKQLLSRIKLTAGLKLNIKDNAQDGRFSIKVKNSEMEIRTSTMPGTYGESIVLRILNPDSISVSIEKLGIEPRLFKILEEEISKPNGMILNTGPTGSGKTTTLYAFLKRIDSPEIKVITIEDPVEYHIKGITQTQTDVEKGYTFAKGLKSALRQDPDVIMVGEIRDSETAEIAVQSSLTGHLVLSTLHTNTAAGTFPRFVDLGMNPRILGSAINLTMAQRLVRKLCEDCKKEILAEGKDKAIIDKILSGIYNKENYTIENTQKMFVPTGCPKCNNTGYKGRIGVFEAIKVDEEIEKIINESPSEREIAKASKNQGILNMEEDGILKVLKGITSLKELRRVIDLTG